MKNLFTKVLGVDLETEEAVSGYFPTPKSPEKPRSSRIKSEWSSAQETALRERMEDMSEQEILDYVESHSDVIEEEFGRTAYSCTMQLRSMEILPPIEFSDDVREVTYSYPFPRIHTEEEPLIERMFSNYASSFEAGRQPSIVPVLAYGSRVSADDGISQFIHATTPIPYRGNELEDYSQFEREMLTTLAAYLHSPRGFKINGNTLSSNEREIPKILCVTKNEGSYAQVLQRTRLGKDSGLVDTAALDVGSTEVYFIRHSQDEVTFANTRRE